VLYNAKPEALFIQPITVKPTPAGLEFALPGKEVVPTERRDVEIHYPHRDALLLSPVAFEPGQSKLSKIDDWSVNISMGRDADDMVTTVAHGSPFAFLRLSRGDLRLRLPAAGLPLATGGDARVLALQVKGKNYAAFAPTGARWERVSDTEWVAHMPAGKDYASVAALPDGKPETLALFARHAYSFIEATRVSWAFNPISGTKMPLLKPSSARRSIRCAAKFAC
jgi:hypothetical protein